MLADSCAYDGGATRWEEYFGGNQLWGLVGGAEQNFSCVTVETGRKFAEVNEGVVDDI
jgi:hypothetical protein